jgi:hypothetical protein
MEDINYSDPIKEDTNDHDHWDTDIPHNEQAENHSELLGPDYQIRNETMDEPEGSS